MMRKRTYTYEATLAKIVKLYISLHPKCTAMDIASAIDRAKIGMSGLDSYKIGHFIKDYNRLYLGVNIIKGGNGNVARYEVK